MIEELAGAERGFFFLLVVWWRTFDKTQLERRGEVGCVRKEREREVD